MLQGYGHGLIPSAVVGPPGGVLYRGVAINLRKEVDTPVESQSADNESSNLNIIRTYITRCFPTASVWFLFIPKTKSHHILEICSIRCMHMKNFTPKVV